MVDERTRWEIYCEATRNHSCTNQAPECLGYRLTFCGVLSDPPFLGAIKAEVGSIMCSYNRINGECLTISAEV